MGLFVSSTSVYECECECKNEIMMAEQTRNKPNKYVADINLEIGIEKTFVKTIWKNENAFSLSIEK